MKIFEFKVYNTNEKKVGNIIIENVDSKNININYRYELNSDDEDWQGHYRSVILNGSITEEYLRRGSQLEVLIKSIFRALESCNDISLVNSIKNAYLNKNIKTTIFES